jgi:hypothetical protein
MGSHTEGHIEKVRWRAYEIYLERCRLGTSGDELEDWSKAERETPAEHRGRAQARPGTITESVTDEHGHDIENPT